MKGKRLLSSSLAAVLSLSLLAGCGGGNSGGSATPAPAGSSSQPAPEGGKSVTLSVVTTYAGEDTNAPNFQAGVAAWEAATGNKIEDRSTISDETFKSTILADFEMGSEPDILFFFNGKDANPIVSAGKVVSIDEIRSVYPDYATNMKDDMLGASPYDGKNYSVPVNGYWETMFVNKSVLEAAGVAVPGPDYTYDQFLADCQAIKDAGYTPIAAALGHIPHYWFEYCIYNHLTPATHNILPDLPTVKGADGSYSFAEGDYDTTNAQYQAWIAGLNDIKDLYERGYFPQNTLSATDDETQQMFYSGKAAFMIDGSWRVGGIENACGKDDDNGIPVDESLLANFTVSYFGGQGERKGGDIITGLSSGYYITRKAWDDPEKQAAAVAFVEYMTSDEMVTKFAGASTSALKNGVDTSSLELSSLGLAGMDMVKNATGAATGAVQDQISDAARVSMFVPGMSQIVTGAATAEQAVQEALSVLADETAG